MTVDEYYEGFICSRCSKGLSGSNGCSSESGTYCLECFDSLSLNPNEIKKLRLKMAINGMPNLNPEEKQMLFDAIEEAVDE